MSRAAVAAAALAIAALGLAPAARATSATSAQVRALARAARTDPDALARLRDVDRVDGRPMPIRRVLTARGRALDARLATLAQGGTTVERASGATRDARAVLSKPRYSGAKPVPRPLHGVLQWIARELDRLAEATSLSRLFRWLDGKVPGGPYVLEVILAALVLAAAAAMTMWLARRRAPVRDGEVPSRPGRPVSADDLERAAEEAERAGDLGAAVRLRFQAGLVRLRRVRAIPPRTSLTNGEIRRRLRLDEFARLAAGFDEVVYGRRRAEPGDVELARTEWPRVLEKARGA